MPSNSLWILKTLVNIFMACWCAFEVTEKLYSLYYDDTNSWLKVYLGIE